MKKKIRGIVAVLSLALAMILCFAFAACGDDPSPDPTPSDPTVTEITLDTSGVKTEFEFGETFSSAGLKVSAKMSDNTTKEISLSECRINPPNMQEAGEQTVVVTHTSSRKSASYTVTVKNRPINETPLLSIEGEKTDAAYRVEAEDIDLEATDAECAVKDGSFIAEIAEASGNTALTNYGVVGNVFAFRFDSDRAYTGVSVAIAFANQGSGVTPVQNNLSVSMNDEKLNFRGGISPNTSSYVWREVFVQDLTVLEGRNTFYFTVTGTSNLYIDYIDFYVGLEPTIPETKSYVDITEATTYVQEAESDLNLFDFVPQAGFSAPPIETSTLASGGKSIGGVGPNSTFTVGLRSEAKATVRAIARIAKFEGGRVSNYASFTFDGQAVDLGDKELSAGYGNVNETKFWNWNDVVVGEFDVDSDKVYDFTFNTPSGAINIDALKFAVLTYGEWATDEERSVPTPNAYIAEAGNVVVEAETLDASTWVNTDGQSYGETSGFSSNGKSIGHLAAGSTINVNVKLSDDATVLVSGDMSKYESDYVLADNVSVFFDDEELTLPEVTFGGTDANPYFNWQRVAFGRYDLEAGFHTLSLVVKEGANAPNIDRFDFTVLSYGSFTEAEVTGIAVKEQPTNKTYYAGESFDPAGMKVVLTGTDGAEFFEVTDDCSFSPAGALTPDVTEVTVSYGGYTQTVSGISVQAITALEVESLPTKVDYKEGDRFEPAGMKINGVFADGHKVDVTSAVTYNEYVTEDGVTVSYAGVSLPLELNVTSSALTIDAADTFVYEAEALSQEGFTLRSDLANHANRDGNRLVENATGASGGKSIGGLAAGSYAEIRLNVKADAVLDLIMVAAHSDPYPIGTKLSVTVDGEPFEITGDHDFQGTGGASYWDWSEGTIGTLSLSAGKHTVRITFVELSCNVDCFKFAVTSYGASA